MPPPSPISAGRLNKADEFPLFGKERAGEILKKSLFNYGLFSKALMFIRREKGNLRG